tara:strand:+ start:3406 stop:3591 length:186 start_codon:yes stop_codon:yes gene_type:complete
MSKGSKPRPKDDEVFGDNYDSIFNKGKKKVKTTKEDHKVSWDWAKDALKRQDELQRKKKKR